MGPDWCKRWGSNPLAPQSPGFTDRCHTCTAALATWRKRQESNPLVPGSLTLTGFQDQRPTMEHLFRIWGRERDSNSQSAGSKPAAFAILATPALLNFQKFSHT